MRLAKEEEDVAAESLRFGRVARVRRVCVSLGDNDAWRLERRGGVGVSWAEGGLWSSKCA